jgi:CDGSH-type Zn-finger protein
MSEIVVRCRPSGPLVIEGPVTVVDHNGNAFVSNSGKPVTALCRCGHSANKPFCDGKHKTSGFVAEETAPPAQA